MAYTDKTYFLTKIKQASLDKLTEGVDANLTAAIASADSLIDSYLSSVISQLPLQSPPEIIRQLSYDIALFYLHDRIQYVDIPDWVKTKFDAAVFFLKDVARGQANIPSLTAEQTEEGIRSDANYPRFDRRSF